MNRKISTCRSGRVEMDTYTDSEFTDLQSLTACDFTR